MPLRVNALGSVNKQSANQKAAFAELQLQETAAAGKFAYVLLRTIHADGLCLILDADNRYLTLARSANSHCYCTRTNDS